MGQQTGDSLWNLGLNSPLLCGNMLCQVNTDQLVKFFGVGVSTVCVLVHQITAALKMVLFKWFVDLQNGARL